MYRDKIIGVVVPCYNEAKQISDVIKTIPKYVDKIIVIDDKSKDTTKKVVKELKNKYKRIILIEHKINQGVGGSIASGYKWCRNNKIDVVAVMAGDGQMLPKDLSKILDPVVEDLVDYSKANRLLSDQAHEKIPRIRYLGNSVLSFFTKMASGYWHIMDSQTGYTAINSKMLKLIDWDKMYKRYGQPNDLLVRLNVYNARVKDIPLDPVYNVGEKSGIKIQKVFVTIPKMLIKMFFWRMKEKYIFRDFHPLVLFYFAGFINIFLSILLLIRFIYMWILTGEMFKMNFMAFMLCSLMGVQFVLFAMWFDMEYNKDLKCK